MTLTELENKFPQLLNFTKNMPVDIRGRCTVRLHPAGSIIHQKNYELHYFGIVAQGENRVINEFENGNVFMIESNKAIDFIGEVTILANMAQTSVTIEAVTDNIVAYISRKDAERWLSEDMNILLLTSHHTAYKLYRSSSINGARLFYPPSYLLLDYLVRYSYQNGISEHLEITVNKTRQVMQEETGINVKTLNRTIKQLKEEGFLQLYKGKIKLTYDQCQKAAEWVKCSI